MNVFMAKLDAATSTIIPAPLRATAVENRKTPERGSVDAIDEIAPTGIDFAGQGTGIAERKF